MSERFSEVAATIPDDIGHLGARLAGILNAAAAEADEIRAEAVRFVDAIKVEAEQNATRTVAEARLEYESAVKLRLELEARSEQAAADIARLRQQATQDAESIVAEAETRAEEILVRAQLSVNSRVEAARDNLDSVVSVRAMIVEQLEDFYRRFLALERSTGDLDRVRIPSASEASADVRHRHGTHSILSTEAAGEPLGDARSE